MATASLGRLRSTIRRRFTTSSALRVRGESSHRSSGLQDTGTGVFDTLRNALGERLQQPVVLDLETHHLRLEIGNALPKSGRLTKLVGGGTAEVPDEGLGH